jgi:hypothetical protein
MDYLNTLTTQQLKDIIRYHNLHFKINFSKLRKADLIEKINKFYSIAETEFSLKPEEFIFNTPEKKVIKRKMKVNEGNKKLNEIFERMKEMEHDVKKKRVSRKGKDVKAYKQTTLAF